MPSAPFSPELLTEANYRRGMLIDDEWMAGVSAQKTGGFLAFVVDYLSGESVGQKVCASLAEALAAVNGLNRRWRFESTSGCGSPECGPEGKCGTQTCPKVARKQEKATAIPEDSRCCPSETTTPNTP